MLRSVFLEDGPCREKEIERKANTDKDKMREWKGRD